MPASAPASQKTRAEYTEPRRSQRGSTRRNSTRSQSRRRLRVLFFSLAAIWGYVVGGASLAAVLAVTGRFFALDGWSLLLLVGCAGIAIGGGLVTAAAYREARRR